MAETNLYNLRRFRLGLPAQFFLLLTLAFYASAAGPPAGTYTNPLRFHVADPFVLRHNGIYYLTGTSADDGFKIWTSLDLVHWRPHGYAFRRTIDSWGHDSFWAPALLEHNGTFYLYYSARGPITRTHDSLRICAATSPSPLGPYHDAAAPMFDIGKANIDVHVMVDDDGKGYVYYDLDCSENFHKDGSPVSQVFVLPLNPDLISVPKGAKPTLCIQPDTAWEGTQWNEGPFVFKHGKTYIMMYSANAFFDANYALGYATAPTPLGPWTKSKDNPVLHQNGSIKGTGHNAVIASPDGKELFCIYHVHDPYSKWGDRMLAIDRMKIIDLAGGGVQLKVLGPTSTPQRLPSGSPVPQEALSH